MMTYRRTIFFFFGKSVSTTTAAHIFGYDVVEETADFSQNFFFHFRLHSNFPIATTTTTTDVGVQHLVSLAIDDSKLFCIFFKTFRFCLHRIFNLQTSNGDGVGRRGRRRGRRRRHHSPRLRPLPITSVQPSVNSIKPFSRRRVKRRRFHSYSSHRSMTAATPSYFPNTSVDQRRGSARLLVASASIFLSIASASASTFIFIH